MTTATKPLEELILELPPALQTEVRDFVEFLLTKRDRPLQRTLRQDWAEAVQDTPQNYTSVGLQHRALEWRTE